MARISRNIWIVAAAALALGACSAGDSSSAQTAGPSQEQTTTYLSEAYFDETEAGVVLGNPDATVTLVEYASLTCGHCKTFHEEVIPTIKRDYVATGKVKFVFREFPTDPVNIAVIGFAIARCAGPDGYFEALDDFFGNQDNIFNEAREGRALEALQAYGVRNGTSESEFETCINSEDIRRAISKSVSTGRDAGVNSTPTLILNGEKLVTGESRTPEGLSAIIDTVLAEAAASDTTQ
jgi:protein-disulfide isomerase